MGLPHYTDHSHFHRRQCAYSNNSRDYSRRDRDPFYRADHTNSDKHQDRPALSTIYHHRHSNSDRRAGYVQLRQRHCPGPPYCTCGLLPDRILCVPSCWRRWRMLPHGTRLCDDLVSTTCCHDDCYERWNHRCRTCFGRSRRCESAHKYLCGRMVLMWFGCRAHRGVLPEWLSVRHSELHVVIWLDPGSHGDQGAPELGCLVTQFLPRSIVGYHCIWHDLDGGLGCFCGVRRGGTL